MRPASCEGVAGGTTGVLEGRVYASGMDAILAPTGAPLGQICRPCGTDSWYVGREQTPSGQRRVRRCVHCAHQRLKAQNRDSELRRRYGVSAADYDSLFKAQCGRCAICGERPTGKRRLAVDHDHRTGVVRGLLCAPCNTALGVVESGFPAKAADYLARLKSCPSCGEHKSVDAFARDRTATTGRCSHCKGCRKRRASARLT